MLSKYNIRCRLFFKDIDGEPFKLSAGQEDIFRIIYEPSIKRGVIKTITQYGKSEVASMALVMAAVERKEKILIVAPSEKQAKIIMGKIIEHLFDHDYLTKMIEYTGKLELLKSERSKTKITFRNGSEIMLLTAEAKTVAREGKGLMGFGATIVLVDESSLIPDRMYSKILRMVGGVKKGRGKLIQLGNPFEDNHFGNAFRSERYEKVSIDWKQALSEGRITQEFLDEAKEDMPPMDWLIFYEVKFPKFGPEDALIPMDWIELAVNNRVEEGEEVQAGLDVARFGNDKTVFIMRKGFKVTALEEVTKMDTMEVVGWVRPMLDKEPELEGLAVDIVGLGAGVYDRLLELNYEVREVNVGEAPSDDEAKEKFYNLRAEIFWNLRNMFKPDSNGKSEISIPNDPELKKELSEIRYKYSSEKKIKIESKEEMKKRLGHSPDKADALALAFHNLEGDEPIMTFA